MYYRYKSKRKNFGYLKVIAFVLIAGVLVFVGIRYGEYFAFWRYNQNTLEQRLQKVSEMPVSAEKTAELAELQAISDGFLEENPLSSDAFFLAARLGFIRGEAALTRDLSARIRGGSGAVPEEVRRSFYGVIRNIRKGMALENGARPDDIVLLMLAKSIFYSDYYPVEEAYNVISEIREPEKLTSLDDRRFFGLMLILKGMGEEGITYLRTCGQVDSREGRLFLAAAYTLARQYTEAISLYRELLQEGGQEADAFDIRRELGGVYMRQSLYREALEEFSAALVLQPGNSAVAIELAQVYIAMKDPAAARTTLQSVPQDSPERSKAQELLDSLK